MVTVFEARKLQHDMKQELNEAPSVVLKCAVMLLLIIGIAWIGAPAGRVLASSATPGMARAEPYSKSVFEERRQRYIEAYPDSRVAREAKARRQRKASSDGGHFA